MDPASSPNTRNINRIPILTVYKSEKLFQRTCPLDKCNQYQKEPLVLGNCKRTSHNQVKTKFSVMLKKLLDAKKVLTQKTFVFDEKRTEERHKNDKRNVSSTFVGTVNLQKKYIKIKINNRNRFSNKTRISDLPTTPPESGLHSPSNGIQTQTGTPKTVIQVTLLKC